MNNHVRTRITVAAAALMLPVGIAAPVALAAPAAAQQQDTRPVGERAVQQAATHDGKNYTYGATGPDEFDCSGYIQFVFGQVGVAIPRTIADQYAASQKVDKAAAQPGDLIAYQDSSGRVTHGGIYAGDGKTWIASTGSDRVMLQSIYTDRYSVGRFS